MENQTQSISKRVLSALQEVVRTALRQNYKKESPFIKRHTDYVIKLHNAKYPDAHARRMAKKVFSNEEAYAQKLEMIRDYYRDDLLISYEKLYEIYHEIVQTQPPQRQKFVLSKEEEDKSFNELFGGLNIS